MGRPGASQRQWNDWRLYVERQWPARVGSQFSFRRHLFNKDLAFRPNIVADSAHQLGVNLRLLASRGADPRRLRWALELSLDAETGTYAFARPAVIAETVTPLPGEWRLHIELAGGTSTGSLPVQSLWYLGGPASLRGFAPATAAGDAFWRGRAALGSSLWLEIFTDFGWAGPRDEITMRDPPFLSVGAGLAGLEVFRFDVARALREPVGWRADL